MYAEQQQYSAQHTQEKQQNIQKTHVYPSQKLLSLFLYEVSFTEDWLSISRRDRENTAREKRKNGDARMYTYISIYMTAHAPGARSTSTAALAAGSSELFSRPLCAGATGAASRPLYYFYPHIYIYNIPARILLALYLFVVPVYAERHPRLYMRCYAFPLALSFFFSLLSSAAADLRDYLNAYPPR